MVKVLVAVVVLGYVLRLGFKRSKEQGEKVIKIEQMRATVRDGVRVVWACTFHFVEIFHFVKIRSIFCLYFHGALEFFLLNLAALIQV